MKGFLDRHPSTAVVISIIALVMATIGTGYAALKLPKKSVGTKQLKKNSVTTAKIRKNAVTGAKVKKRTLTGKDINLKKLGTVPSAEVANSVPPREGVHQVGAPGEVPFLPGASNFGVVPPGVNLPAVGFFKDHDDVVHLEGVAKVVGKEGLIFTLPPGLRPPAGTAEFYEPGENTIIVLGANVVLGGEDLSGVVISEDEAAVLSGLTFRAGS
jgi:hypothetical protein